MATYEAPTLTEVGSVRDVTLGGLNLVDWSDEIRHWPYRAPGTFS